MDAACPSQVADFVRVFLREPVFSNIRDAIAENLRNVDTLRVGSMCSGWGVLEMVLGTLQHEWNEQELGHSHFKAIEFSDFLPAVCFHMTKTLQNTGLLFLQLILRIILR